MTWAVRGCAGAGGLDAHVAPGLTWGAAWWLLARDRGHDQPERSRVKTPGEFGDGYGTSSQF